jgi:hypothetical protein
MIDAVKEFIETPIANGDSSTEKFYLNVGRKHFAVHVTKKIIKDNSHLNSECIALILDYFVRYAERNQKCPTKNPSSIKYVCIENVTVSVQFSIERILWLKLPSTKKTIEEKTLEMIASAGSKGKSQSEITVFLHNHPRDIRENIVKTLINTGKIESKPVMAKTNSYRVQFYAIGSYE